MTCVSARLGDYRAQNIRVMVETLGALREIRRHVRYVQTKS